MAKRIVELLPPHTVYAEPFAGSCSVLFAKPIPQITNSNHYREAINDLDEALVTMYRVMQDTPLRFFRKIKATLYSQSEHCKARIILNNPTEHSDLDRAWAYYVKIQQSFAHVLVGGWGRGVYAENWGDSWHHRVEMLREQLKRFASVNVSCVDALTFIKQWDSPQTCFYCDPPYMDTDQRYTCQYTQEQYQALIDTLSNCQGSFVLSHYPTKQVSIPESWERYEFSTSLLVSGRGKVGSDKARASTSQELGDRKRTEVLWRVDRSATIRKELQPVIAKLFPQQL